MPLHPVSEPSSFGEQLRSGADELRSRVGAVALAATAGGVAWLLARELTGHPSPVFAPVAAVLTLGLSAGRQVRRAVEIAVGVALGIGIADALALAIGTGTWQLIVVLFLAMSAAVLTGGGQLLANQAAIAATFVITVQPPSGGFDGSRLIDSLIGGLVGVVFFVCTPNEPLRSVGEHLAPLMSELRDTLLLVERALRDRDGAAARSALQRARTIDLAPLTQALSAARETVPVTRRRRDAQVQLDVVERATRHIDHAVRNARVLARGAVGPAERGEGVPATLLAAIHELADAVAGTSLFLTGSASPAEAAGRASSAASEATAALHSAAPSLATGMLVGQVRLISVDLLRALGSPNTTAVDTATAPHAETIPTAPL